MYSLKERDQEGRRGRKTGGREGERERERERERETHMLLKQSLCLA